MKKILLIITIILFSYIFSAHILFAKEISATTENGKIVVLKDDGTWEYFKEGYVPEGKIGLEVVEFIKDGDDCKIRWKITNGTNKKAKKISFALALIDEYDSEIDKVNYGCGDFSCFRVKNVEAGQYSIVDESVYPSCDEIKGIVLKKEGYRMNSCEIPGVSHSKKGKDEKYCYNNLVLPNNEMIKRIP